MNDNSWKQWFSLGYDIDSYGEDNLVAKNTHHNVVTVRGTQSLKIDISNNSKDNECKLLITTDRFCYSDQYFQMVRFMIVEVGLLVLLGEFIFNV